MGRAAFGVGQERGVPGALCCAWWWLVGSVCVPNLGSVDRGLGVLGSMGGQGTGVLVRGAAFGVRKQAFRCVWHLLGLGSGIWVRGAALGDQGLVSGCVGLPLGFREWRLVRGAGMGLC